MEAGVTDFPAPDDEKNFHSRDRDRSHHPSALSYGHSRTLLHLIAGILVRMLQGRAELQFAYPHHRGSRGITEPPQPCLERGSHVRSSYYSDDYCIVDDSRNGAFTDRMDAVVEGTCCGTLPV